MKQKSPKRPKSNKSTSGSSSSGHEAETYGDDPTEKAGQAAVVDRNPRTLLGQILVELGYVTVYQLDEALHAQRTERASEKAKSTGEKDQKPLGQIMLELGYCTPNQLIRAIQVQSDYRKAAVRFRDNW